MAKSKRSKRVKASNGGVDRISNLPDHLISHILSLLPTSKAVATSILSTKWKFQWTSITNLVLACDCEGYEHETEEEENFTLFVNRVLLLLDSPSIQNFSITCGHSVDPIHLHSWISAGFKLTLGVLEFSFTLSVPVELDLSQFCSNIVVLNLNGDIDFYIPETASVCFPCMQALHLSVIACRIDKTSSVSFPNLKIMYLSFVFFANDDSIHKLFSSSLVLDGLVIEIEDYNQLKSLIIRIPSLTSLSLEIRSSDYYVDQMCKLHIDSPALQYLNLKNELPCEYLPANNLASLLQAKVEIHLRHDYNNNIINVENCTSIIKFIESLSNAKFLKVSGHILKTFRIASENIASAFHNLTRLEINVDDCVDFSTMINIFLQSMDSLEHLVMKVFRVNSCYHQSWWTEPLIVPKCLESRITTASFSYINVDCCDQMELLSYFLKNAKFLEMMTIDTKQVLEKKQLRKKISLMPRGSSACQVVVP